jgi:hypothetical protein
LVTGDWTGGSDGSPGEAGGSDGAPGVAGGGDTSEPQDDSNIIEIISKANSRNLIISLHAG